MPRSVRTDLSHPNEAFRARAGKTIRHWREQVAELTREVLASKLEVSVRTVTRWEEGGVPPRADMVDAMERLAPGLVDRLFPQGGEKLGSEPAGASPDRS